MQNQAGLEHTKGAGHGDWIAKQQDEGDPDAGKQQEPIKILGIQEKLVVLIQQQLSKCNQGLQVLPPCTQTIGKLYGIRDVRSIRDSEQRDVSAACLEFKCSGMLFDQDRVDRTLVKVVPQGSCRRESVNSMLHEYLVNHLPMATNNDSSEYTMLAPLDPLGHNYGIYTVTDQDPRIAKEIALGRCFDGTSDGTSRIMKSDIGVALTFTCSERSAAEQSIFESQRNSGQQSIVVPPPPRESPAFQRPLGSRQIPQSRVPMRGQRPSSY